MVCLWTVNNMAKNKKTIKQNILITGGSGFIGSALTKYLVENNHNVIVYDNNSRGNLRRLKSVIKKIKFIKGDIRNKKKLFSIKQKIDTVIHLAYINGTEFFYKKPFEILDIAVNGLVNILDFSKKKNVKNFYLASSSEVYQNPIKIPTFIDDKPVPLMMIVLPHSEGIGSSTGIRVGGHRPPSLALKSLLEEE